MGDPAAHTHTHTFSFTALRELRAPLLMAVQTMLKSSPYRGDCAHWCRLTLVALMWPATMPWTALALRPVGGGWAARMSEDAGEENVYGR